MRTSVTDHHGGSLRSNLFRMTAMKPNLQVCIAILGVVEIQGDNSRLLQSCNDDNGCPEGFYCAAGTCASLGTCASQGVVDCFHPQSNRNLPTRPECQVNDDNEQPSTCQYRCGSDCPGGKRPYSCFESPCATDRTKACPEAVHCVEDCCGGCFAIYFDASGNLVVGI